MKFRIISLAFVACIALFSKSVMAQTPVPAITGNISICVSGTTQLFDVLADGTWFSSNSQIATVDNITGVVAGAAAGTATITYFVGKDYASVVVTVNALPSPIQGITALCVGTADTLSDSTVGGTWSTSSMTAGTVDANGIVTGIAAGTTTITYSMYTGCMTSTVITVNATPSGITGPGSVCTGYTITLIDSATGGIWISGAPATATVDGSGIVTGLNPGTAVISYLLNGCPVVSTTVSVGQSPVVSITGAPCSDSVLTVNSSLNYDSVVWKKDSAIIKVTVPQPFPSSIVSIGKPDKISPNGLFITEGGDLYATDYNGSRVLKYPAGFNKKTAGIVVAKKGLHNPQSIFVDGQGYIYVSNAGVANVLKFPPWSNDTTTGIIVAQNGLNTPHDISLDAAGNLFVANGYGENVLEYPTGSDSTTPPAVAATLLGPVLGICVVNDTIYAADASYNIVNKYAPTGSFGLYGPGIVVAGVNNNGGSSDNLLMEPMDVSIGNTGSLYVADVLNNRIQKFPPGSVSGASAITVGGTGGTGSSPNQLNNPANAKVDARGNLYIADEWNNRIQVYYNAAGGPDTLMAVKQGIYTATVTSITGCSITSDAIHVHRTGAILGKKTVRVNAVCSLADTTAGGTWKSLAPNIATVNTKGIVSGVTAGTAVINYTANGCTVSTTVTVVGSR